MFYGKKIKSCFKRVVNSQEKKFNFFALLLSLLINGYLDNCIVSSYEQNGVIYVNYYSCEHTFTDVAIEDVPWYIRGRAKLLKQQLELKD